MTPDNTELREQILHILTDSDTTSEEAYVDTKAKFLIDDLLALIGVEVTRREQILLSEFEAAIRTNYHRYRGLDTVGIADFIMAKRQLEGEQS